MIATIGARTMIYPLRKVVRLVALAWIFQGHVAQPPRTAVMKAPRCMLRYFGARKAKSLDEAIELVEILVPRVARPKANAQKKAAALFVQRAMIMVGSQKRVPYIA
jgi:hypothetical protein